MNTYPRTYWSDLPHASVLRPILDAYRGQIGHKETTWWSCVAFRGLPVQQLFDALVWADLRSSWVAVILREELKRRDARGELWT